MQAEEELAPRAVEICPALQLIQEEFEPTAVEYVPPMHWPQVADDVAPMTVEYVPEGHAPLPPGVSPARMDG